MGLPNGRPSAHNARMEARGTDRLFSWLLVLLIAAGAFFGLAPFLAPALFASVSGFKGTDVFMYRLAGAATFGYAVGLAVGFRAGWTALRIPIAATFVFNLASIGACAAAIAAGAQPVVFLILAASILFTSATGYFLVRPPEDRWRADDPGLASWVTALFLIGMLAAAFFGLAPLILGGAFGHALGYSGDDDFVYRQAGAATLGTAVGGLLVLLSRRWARARIAAIMALTFNALSVVAAVLEIAAGGQPVAWLILAAAALVTVGMSAAIMRGGR
jgi:hypothetical protein